MPWLTPTYPCGHRGNPVPTYASAEGRVREYQALCSAPCPICKVNAEVREALAKVPDEVKARVAEDCRLRADFWRRHNR